MSKKKVKAPRAQKVVDEIAAAQKKEAALDKKLGPVDAKCEVCGFEVEVPNLRKSGCPSCGHAGLVAK